MTVELENRPASSGLIAPSKSAPVTLSAYLTATVTISGSLSLGALAEDQTAFQRERTTFRLMLPRLQEYAGQFVAIHGGRVVTSGTSRNAVIRGFFSEYPENTSVYIGFVGPRPVARVPTPLVVRSKH